MLFYLALHFRLLLCPCVDEKLHGLSLLVPRQRLLLLANLRCLFFFDEALDHCLVGSLFCLTFASYLSATCFVVCCYPLAELAVPLATHLIRLCSIPGRALPLLVYTLNLKS
jgi:hypothetical protein